MPMRPLLWLAVVVGSSFGAQAQQQVPRSPSSIGLVRWGTDTLGTTLRLQRLDVDAMSVSPPISITTPAGPSGPLATVSSNVIPVVSDNEFSAAIPVSLGDPMIVFPAPVRTGVFTWRDIRGASASQSSGYWLPLVDPSAVGTQWKIVGSPRFRTNSELWVLEIQETSSASRAYRLARYGLGLTAPTFLGAAALVDPLHSDITLPTEHWLIDGDQAVFLQQNGPQGLELVRYSASGTVVGRVSVDPAGFAVFHASFQGILKVPGHRWGLVQYGTAANGECSARFIDLVTGLMTPPDAVGLRVGRVSSDGRLAIFGGVAGPSANDMIPVVVPASITGVAFSHLPAVGGYFCSGDSLGVDDSDILSAPSGCAGLVRRARLDPAGQFSVTSVSTATGGGPPFDIAPGPTRPPRAFRYPERERVYTLSGAPGVMQWIDVATMTYGPTSVTMSIGKFLF